MHSPFPFQPASVQDLVGEGRFPDAKLSEPFFSDEIRLYILDVVHITCVGRELVLIVYL